MSNFSNFNKMNKQTLKAYEAPKAEVIEIETQGVVMAASGESTPSGNRFTNGNFGEE